MSTFPNSTSDAQPSRQITVDDISKRGYLVKQGRFIRNWKRRFFVLKNGALFYYKSPEDIVPISQMSLYSASCVFVDLDGGGLEKAHTLSISVPDRTLYVQADPKAASPIDDLKDWAFQIQRAALVESGVTAAAKETSDLPSHGVGPAGGAGGKTDGVNDNVASGGRSGTSSGRGQTYSDNNEDSDD